MEDAPGLGAGFVNGANTTEEYTYKADGALTSDQNKGISSVVYNVLGKPLQVNFTDGRKLEYAYSASGTKLSMKTYAAGGSLQTTTDYVGGFVYENNALKFFGSPEGRIVKNGSDFEYQYAIGDHQGNTRVVFTSAGQTPDEYLATFENPQSDEEEFDNVPDASPNWVSFTAANHTPSGIKVVRLNQNLNIGPSKSLNVYPGDTVDMEVWTYYENSSGFGTTSPALNTLITAVAGAFGGVGGGGGEAGAIYNGVDGALTAFGTGGNNGDNSPGAYLNYILFDKDYHVLDMGWEIATGYNAQQKISISDIPVTEAGYIFVYLSYENESNNYVQFDDLKVTHRKTNVIQYNEYYPFGLQTSNSWTRDDATGNNFLYNGPTETNTTTGWGETMFRSYDPVLGRFMQVDPMASAYAMWSPYHYAANNPVGFNDPTGLYPAWYPEYPGSVGSLEERLFKDPSDSGFNSGGSRYSGPGSGKHWSDGVRGVEGNFALMSRSTFEGFYGVDLGSDAGRSWASQYLGAGGNQAAAFFAQSIGGEHYGGGLIGVEGYFHYDANGNPTTVDGNISADFSFYIWDFSSGKGVLSQWHGDRSAASPSAAGLLLAGVGATGLVAEYQSKIILGSRSGFKSGKLSPTSPRVYSKTTAGRIQLGAKSIGWGLTIWSVYSTEAQFRNGQMDPGRRRYNHLNSAVGVLFPVTGLPLAAGDYLGQRYSNEIVNDISKPGGILFEGMKFTLELLRIPTEAPK